MVLTASASNIPESPGRPSTSIDMTSVDDILFRYTCESEKRPHLLDVGEELNSNVIPLFGPIDIRTTYIPSTFPFKRDSVGTNTTPEVIGILSHTLWRFERESPAQKLTWVKMVRYKESSIYQDNVM